MVWKRYMSKEHVMDPPPYQEQVMDPPLLELKKATNWVKLDSAKEYILFVP
jgi:hypothetical protein